MHWRRRGQVPNYRPTTPPQTTASTPTLRTAPSLPWIGAGAAALSAGRSFWRTAKLHGADQQQKLSLLLPDFSSSLEPSDHLRGYFFPLSLFFNFIFTWKLLDNSSPRSPKPFPLLLKRPPLGIPCPHQEFLNRITPTWQLSLWRTDCWQDTNLSMWCPHHLPTSPALPSLSYPATFTSVWQTWWICGLLYFKRTTGLRSNQNYLLFFKGCFSPKKLLIAPVERPDPWRSSRYESKWGQILQCSLWPVSFPLLLLTTMWLGVGDDSSEVVAARGC